MQKVLPKNLTRENNKDNEDKIKTEVILPHEETHSIGGAKKEQSLESPLKHRTITSQHSSTFDKVIITSDCLASKTFADQEEYSSENCSIRSKKYRKSASMVAVPFPVQLPPQSDSLTKNYPI